MAKKRKATNRNAPDQQFADEIDPAELTPEVEAALDAANDAVAGAAQEAARARQAEAGGPPADNPLDATLRRLADHPEAPANVREWARRLLEKGEYYESPRPAPERP